MSLPKQTHLKAINFAFLMLLFLPFAKAQLTVSATVVDATCASNGSISVDVTGGSGSYSYLLVSSCLANDIPSSTPDFDFLPPCPYTITVIDLNDNSTGQTMVTVSSVNQPLSLSLDCTGCGISANASAGAGNYTFALSTAGLGGPFTPNSPADSPVFDDLQAGAPHWVQVQDACGNIIVQQCQTAGNPITGVDWNLDDTGISINGISGGAAPYTYTLTSSQGTETNMTGDFPAALMDCDAQLTVTDNCTDFTLELAPSPEIISICVNFGAGTAEVLVEGFFAPLVVTAMTDSMNFTSTDGNFTGLPIGVDEYSFVVEDSCGRVSGVVNRQAKWPIFPDVTLNCSDNTLPIGADDEECGGGFYGSSLPVEVVCLSCPSSQSGTLNSEEDEILFTGNTPGSWEVSFEDRCGEQMICRDTIILEVVDYCDTIFARPLSRFICDNGRISEIPLIPNDATFWLVNSIGDTIATNSNGVFADLPQGDYEVFYLSANCGGALSEIGTINPPGLLTADYEVSAYGGVGPDGNCGVLYNIVLETSLGPYLVDGQTNSYYDTTEYSNDCTRFGSFGLPPGTYLVQSLDNCGQLTLDLPEIPAQLTASATGGCIGGGAITVTGAQDAVTFAALLADLNVPFPISWEERDYYSLDQPFGGDPNHTGASYTFFGVSTGWHTVYLHRFGSDCFVDSTSVFVPSGNTLSAAVDVNSAILCDNATTTDLLFSISGGAPPFRIEVVDCDNFTVPLQSFTSDSSRFVLPNASIGRYCLRFIDECQTSRDLQVQVRYFEDAVQVEYNCDNTISLAVNNISAQFNWVDQTGTSLGNTSRTTIPNPNGAATITASINIGSCTVERTVELPDSTWVPSLAFSGDSSVCIGQDTAFLTANSNLAGTVIWNTGDTTASLAITTPGIYSATLTSELGCMVTEAVEVTATTPTPLNLDQMGSGCPGDSSLVWIETTAPLTRILWSTGATGDTVFANSGTTVDVSVLDAFGCAQSDTLLVDLVANAVPEITGDTVICPNATSLLSLSENYASYNWSSGSNAPSISAAAGQYTVSVTNADGCLGVDSFEVVGLPAVSATLSGNAILCRPDTVDLQIVLNNAPDSAWVWLNTDAAPFRLLDSLTVPIGINTTSSFAIDSVFVTNYGCSIARLGGAQFAVSTLAATAEPLVFPNTFNTSCADASDGQIAVAVQSGPAPFTYLWNDGTTDSLRADLPAGDYTYTITDGFGCSAADTVVLTAPQPLTFGPTVVPAFCPEVEDGALLINDFENAFGDLTVVINDQWTLTAPADLQNLPPGDYYLAATDALGCFADTVVNLPIPAPFEVAFGSVDSIALGDSLRLAIVNSSNQFLDTVHWATTQYLTNIDLTGAWAQPTHSITYRIEGFTENGCRDTAQVSVFVDREVPIFPPTAFSPNGDGINDRFTLFAHLDQVIAIRELQIFDRWGGRLFVAQDLAPNDLSVGWDGTSRGERLHQGVYTWWAEVELIDGTMVPLKGDVTLIR